MTWVLTAFAVPGVALALFALGGLVSNADDLARFFRALLDGRLLRPDLLRVMRTTVAARQLGRGHEYGLGLQRLPEPSGAA